MGFNLVLFLVVRDRVGRVIGVEGSWRRGAFLVCFGARLLR